MDDRLVKVGTTDTLHGFMVRVLQILEVYVWRQMLYVYSKITQTQDV